MALDTETERRLTEVESRARSNSHRLDDVERRQGDLEDLVSTVKVLAVRQESVETDVREIKADVKDLSGRSGRRWDSILDKLIWATLSGCLAYVWASLQR